MNFLSPRKKSTSSQPIILGLLPWPFISFSLPDYNLISTRNFGLEFPFNLLFCSEWAGMICKLDRLLENLQIKIVQTGQSTRWARTHTFPFCRMETNDA